MYGRDYNNGMPYHGLASYEKPFTLYPYDKRCAENGHIAGPVRRPMRYDDLRVRHVTPS
jgi:hypothetical protein